MTKIKREKNPLAVELGRLGGRSTAKRGIDYFKRISELAQTAKQKKRSGKIEAVRLSEGDIVISGETLDEQNLNSGQ